MNQGITVEDIGVKKDIAGWWNIIGPGYPLIIAASLLIFGQVYFPLFLLNALFTSLTIIVLYKLVIEITKNRLIAFFILIWGLFYINYYKLALVSIFI